MLKKNSDEIKENKQLERLLGNFNYLKDFYKILQHSVKPLYEMLNKNPSKWSPACTNGVRKIKLKAKEYGGMLKTKLRINEISMRFTSRVLKLPQKNYSPIK